jgi:hypothetical protein
MPGIQNSEEMASLISKHFSKVVLAHTIPQKTTNE